MIDIIYSAYVLMESKGGSAKAMELFNEGVLQYVADCLADTTLPTTSIVVAKTSVSLSDGNKNYYLGMYKDSVVTQPFSTGMQALGAMPQKSLFLFIKTLKIIFTNITEIVSLIQCTDIDADEIAYKGLTEKNKPQAPAVFHYALIESVSTQLEKK